MNKLSFLVASSALFFVACGGSSATDPDDVSSSNSTANETDFSAEADYSVEAYESLPLCNDKKEGQTGYVSLASKYYVCEDGKWVVTQKPSSPSASADEDDSSHDDDDRNDDEDEVKSSSSRSNSIPDYLGKSSESSGANAGGYDPSTGILTDSRDGHVQKYKTTKIGKQVWMAENLNYAYLQPTEKMDSSSFCYDNDPAMCKKYGRLYLWSAAMDSAGVLKNEGKGKGCGYGVKCDVEGTVQGICPKGWHLPSKDEFEKMLAFVETAIDSIVKYKKQNMEALVKGINDVKNHLRDHSWEDGFDTFGFSALPAGHYYYDIKKFSNLGYSAGFWASTDYYDSYDAYVLVILGSYADLDSRAYVSDSEKNFGYSVRCLQD